MLVHCLRDGIYPACPTFVNTMPKPQGKKRVHFEHLACCELGLQLCVDLLALGQEVLLKHHNYLCDPLHNMIVETESNQEVN
jgi:hypothetical protein